MHQLSFRQWFDSMLKSLPATVRTIDTGLILIDLVFGLIVVSHTPTYVSILFNAWMIIGLHLLLLPLGWITPFQQARWKRRSYVGVCMGILASVTFLGFDFQLILYWWIVKSCFLLPRKEVVVMVVGVGIVYLTGYAFLLEQIWDRMIALIAQKGARAVLQPEVSWLNQFMFYLGGSSFSLILGLLVLSERQSRERTEALTQQVKTLGAALERSRIARDIHDSLGHSLTGLGIQLEAVQKLQHRDPEEAQRSLQLAQQLADQCLQDVRRSLSSLRQSDFNLNHAVAALAEQSQHSGFTIEVNFNLPQLPLQMSHQLYCIIQEGLMNVQKHANSTQVIILGSKSSEGIVIRLKDNGQGFDILQSNAAGFGIRGMEERVQILGGQFKIKSTLEQGTEIRIQLPMSAAMDTVYDN